MTVRSKHLKLVGAMGAAALTVGAMAAASPALAANHDLTYTCNVLGPTSSTLNPGAIPAKMTAGQSSTRNMTLAVHLNALQTGTAAALGTSVKGTIVADGKGGTVPFSLKIPATAIPQTPGDTMDATATGKGSIVAAKAGTFKVNAGAIAATLKISGGAGGPQTVPQTCTAPTDGTQTLGTVTVAKDKTKSKVSAKVKGSTATVSDKVTSHFGLKATGKVSFTLKKGSKKVGTAKGKISKKGVAKVSFKHVKSGKYTVSASYKGNSNLKGSTGKGSFNG
jgi:hypothetical protein